MIQRVWAIIFIMLSCSCSRHLYNESTACMHPDPIRIIKDHIEAITQTKEYALQMKQFDRFQQLQLPGIPYNVSELSFSALSDFISNLNELNKAYRFSKLTHQVMVCDTTYRISSLTMEDMIADEMKDILFLSSSTYNDQFYPSYPIPVVTDSIDIWHTFYLTKINDSLFHKKRRQRPNQQPCYTLSFSIARINIERDNKPYSSYVRKKEKLAITKEMILAKDINLTIYRHVAPSNTLFGKPVLNNEISISIKQEGTAIIGFIYSIL